jgi:hypothetical protein
VNSWLITRTDEFEASVLVHDDTDVRVYLMARVEAHKPRLDQRAFLYWISQACRTPPLTFGPMPDGATYDVMGVSPAWRSA